MPIQIINIGTKNMIPFYCIYIQKFGKKVKAAGCVYANS